MLDPWIIEEILKREQEQRRESENRYIELPVERNQGDLERPMVTPPAPPREDSERGVMIIDI